MKGKDQENATLIADNQNLQLKVPFPEDEMTRDQEDRMTYEKYREQVERGIIRAEAPSNDIEAKLSEIARRNE